MSAGSKEVILAAAKRAAMAHGYTGLNFRDIAAEVGIKAPSIYHHFPTKADLGAAVAKRYWEDIVVDLEAISDQSPDPLRALRRYPEIFRKSLSSDNRMSMWHGSASCCLLPESLNPGKARRGLEQSIPRLRARSSLREVVRISHSSTR
jgi:AcrR family transcriptional regulator